MSGTPYEILELSGKHPFKTAFMTFFAGVILAAIGSLASAHNPTLGQPSGISEYLVLALSSIIVAPIIEGLAIMLSSVAIKKIVTYICTKKTRSTAIFSAHLVVASALSLLHAQTGNLAFIGVTPLFLYITLYQAHKTIENGSINGMKGGVKIHIIHNTFACAFLYSLDIFAKILE